jgi:hypothetical protein
VRVCQGADSGTRRGEAWKRSTINERKEGLDVTTEVESDNGAPEERGEQPDERDHMPPSQINELLADMDPDADAPQEPPLDAKSAALTEEKEGPADDR